MASSVYEQNRLKLFFLSSCINVFYDFEVHSPEMEVSFLISSHKHLIMASSFYEHNRMKMFFFISFCKVVLHDF